MMQCNGQQKKHKFRQCKQAGVAQDCFKGKPSGTGPTSLMISRWHDHTRRMASGVPMPAARGSPAGPNQ